MELLDDDIKGTGNHRFGDEVASLHIKLPKLPKCDQLWKETEESNTVRPKVLIDLQTDRLGDLASHQERRHSYSHSKVQCRPSLRDSLHKRPEDVKAV